MKSIEVINQRIEYLKTSIQEEKNNTSIMLNSITETIKRNTDNLTWLSGWLIKENRYLDSKNNMVRLMEREVIALKWVLISKD